MPATSSGDVSRRVWARIVPSSSTTPAAIFVPPMSTPMACMFVCAPTRSYPCSLPSGAGSHAIRLRGPGLTCPATPPPVRRRAYPFGCSRRRAARPVSSGHTSPLCHWSQHGRVPPPVARRGRPLEEPQRPVRRARQQHARRSARRAQVAAGRTLDPPDRSASSTPRSWPSPRASSRAACSPVTASASCPGPATSGRCSTGPIWAAGAVPVPLYETSSAEQVLWILTDAGRLAARRRVRRARGRRRRGPRRHAAPARGARHRRRRHRRARHRRRRR